jgi:hypothetical protein
MANAQSIWQLLQEAVDRLEKAAHEIRDLPLEPRGDHIHRVAEALTQIFEIQYHLFAMEPSLTPSEMKGPFEKPEPAWKIALSHARKAEEQGHTAMAVAILYWFAAQVGSPEHEQRAKARGAAAKGTKRCLTARW